jgi:hypothetical protein
MLADGVSDRVANSVVFGLWRLASRAIAFLSESPVDPGVLIHGGASHPHARPILLDLSLREVDPLWRRDIIAAGGSWGDRIRQHLSILGALDRQVAAFQTNEASEDESKKWALQGAHVLASGSTPNIPEDADLLEKAVGRGVEGMQALWRGDACLGLQSKTAMKTGASRRGWSFR